MFGLFKKGKGEPGGMSAGAIMGMMSALGINVDELMQKAENALRDWFKEQEKVCGHQLTAICNLDNTGQHFILSLWKKKQDGSLELWQSVPLTKIIDLVKNNINADTNAESAATNQLPGATGPEFGQPAAAIAADEPAATTEPVSEQSAAE